MRAVLAVLLVLGSAPFASASCHGVGNSTLCADGTSGTWDGVNKDGLTKTTGWAVAWDVTPGSASTVSADVFNTRTGLVTADAGASGDGASLATSAGTAHVERRGYDVDACFDTPLQRGCV